jgi:hypothetical protein
MGHFTLDTDAGETIIELLSLQATPKMFLSCAMLLLSNES